MPGSQSDWKEVVVFPRTVNIIKASSCLGRGHQSVIVTRECNYHRPGPHKHPPPPPPSKAHYWVYSISRWLSSFCPGDGESILWQAPVQNFLSGARFLVHTGKCIFCKAPLVFLPPSLLIRLVTGCCFIWIAQHFCSTGCRHLNAVALAWKWPDRRELDYRVQNTLPQHDSKNCFWSTNAVLSLSAN